MDEVIVVPPPRAPVYRVGRMPNPFAPPLWTYARPDGAFDGRFDDPGGSRGIPVEDRFRVLYVASESAGAYGETLAFLRPRLAMLARIGAGPPGARIGRPIIPRTWRLGRRVGSTVLHSSLRVVDLAAPETVQALRMPLAGLAVSIGLRDVDHGTLAGPNRRLTQEVARHIYELRDAADQPLYAGMRYLSRLNPSWECWVIFTDRLRHSIVRVDNISANAPGLYEAARILNLAVEAEDGRYLLP